MNDEKRQAVALWKFSLAAPILNQTHTCKSDLAYCRDLVKKPLIHPVTKEEVKISPHTIRSWAFDYRKGGLEALYPAARNDRGSFRVLDQPVRDRIAEIIKEYPRMPGTKVREKLIEEGLITASVSQSSISRCIRSAAPLGSQTDRIHEGRDRKAFEFEHINQMWQADTTYLGKIQGKKIWLMLIIDDCSRMVVGHGMYFEDNAVNFLKTLKKAISIYGRPRILYTDNGAPYANRQLQLILADLQVQGARHRSRDAAAKGYVKKYIMTRNCVMSFI